MEEGGDKKKVMVAIDESECSHYALEWALNNLRESLQNSKLVIFTAQPLADYGYLYASSYGAAPAELVTSVQENHKRVAEALLAKAKEVCSQVSADTFTQVGEPKEAICEAVEQHNPQLLVLGSHGRRALQRAFLGSVSNYCVHNAKCPVLVVRKKEVEEVLTRDEFSPAYVLLNRCYGGLLPGMFIRLLWIALPTIGVRIKKRSQVVLMPFRLVLGHCRDQSAQLSPQLRRTLYLNTKLGLKTS
ncbi:Adenine nucleotide alpha hydrolases-like superfamily protein [Striga hermonthica]|uniref:Adenine nucleotide alpha hydrolases-like superfamily protein n=1 Tax=Striga hermonthica TaxID=68872 RepID=A0A9N7MM19_STRHE|nr:Adenine nucleotide alpha hydrolases-like superfamily protein [Striga hermonthica]